MRFVHYDPVESSNRCFMYNSMMSVFWHPGNKRENFGTNSKAVLHFNCLSFLALRFILYLISNIISSLRLHVLIDTPHIIRQYNIVCYNNYTYIIFHHLISHPLNYIIITSLLFGAPSFHNNVYLILFILSQILENIPSLRNFLI